MKEKRKRGRPVGSKNKKKQQEPVESTPKILEKIVEEIVFVTSLVIDPAYKYVCKSDSRGKLMVVRRKRVKAT